MLQIVRAASDRAGITANGSTRWLRHAHASHALDCGAPIHLVQATCVIVPLLRPGVFCTPGQRSSAQNTFERRPLSLLRNCGYCGCVVVQMSGWRKFHGIGTDKRAWVREYGLPGRKGDHSCEVGVTELGTRNALIGRFRAFPAFPRPGGQPTRYGHLGGLTAAAAVTLRPVAGDIFDLRAGPGNHLNERDFHRIPQQLREVAQ